MTREEGVFREEALAYHFREGGDGSLLQLPPFWVRATFWVLAGTLVAATGLLSLASVHEYAAGPAFVRTEGGQELTATAPGVVSRLCVYPGQWVAAGAVLVELHPAQEAAERDRLQRELEAQLVRRLLDPSDEAARQALTSLRAGLALAEARLAERSVRAPGAGRVGDLRVRPGQAVTPGDVLLSLHTDAAAPSLVALLPGHVRPLLAPGQGLRVELDGFPYEYQEARIDSVGDTLVGPAEMRRFLGPGQADAVPLQGPMVVVQARLASSSFTSDGAHFRYFDGMTGIAQVHLRSRSAFVTLFPVLQSLVPARE